MNTWNKIYNESQNKHTIHEITDWFSSIIWTKKCWHLIWPTVILFTCFYCSFLIGGWLPHLPKFVFTSSLSVCFARCSIPMFRCRPSVSASFPGCQLCRCWRRVTLSPAPSVEVGLRAFSWRCAAWPYRALHSCIAVFLCCRWQLVGSPLTHCVLWHSRCRFTHSIVIVAHSRQCSVICCMHSAGNGTSPLCCTCELIQDAHCLIISRAVAWPDGGRWTSDDSTTIIY